MASLNFRATLISLSSCTNKVEVSRTLLLKRLNDALSIRQLLNMYRLRVKYFIKFEHYTAVLVGQPKGQLDLFLSTEEQQFSLSFHVTELELCAKCGGGLCSKCEGSLSSILR